jgi:hypothetical protein
MCRIRADFSTKRGLALHRLIARTRHFAELRRRHALGSARRRYSDLMLAARITFPHFSVSSRGPTFRSVPDESVAAQEVADGVAKISTPGMTRSNGVENRSPMPVAVGPTMPGGGCAPVPTRTASRARGFRFGRAPIQPPRAASCSSSCGRAHRPISGWVAALAPRGPRT